jgi:hypothetical protein
MTLDNLKKEAKRWLKELRANNGDARIRLERAYPKAPTNPGLRDIQHALALERGFSGWIALKQAAQYESLASDMVTAYATGDAAAMQRIDRHYGRSSTVEDLRATIWRQVYKVRRANGAAEAFGIAEAQELIAQNAGFGNWEALLKGGPAVPSYAINVNENKIGPRREVTADEWDTIGGVMKEQRITALDAHGFMTDDVLKRIAELDHITTLRLGGSRQLTDDGLLHLARMPQLEQLDLTEYPGGKLTDRGLEVLRRLPNLRTFQMCWQQGVSDAGVANLKYCEKLESVNLMGTPTGDGAIDAFARQGWSTPSRYRKAGHRRRPGDAARLPDVQDVAPKRRGRADASAD